MTKGKTKEFKLSEDLEQLVQFSNVSKGLAESAQRKVDNGLIGQAAKFYGALNATGVSGFDPNLLWSMTHGDVFRTLINGRKDVRTVLDNKLDDGTYKGAKGFYLGKLDEDHKIGLYLDVLSEGNVSLDAPKDAKAKVVDSYKALAKAKEELNIAVAIEKSVQADDLDTAKNIVKAYSGGADISYLAITGAYGGPAFRDAEKRICLHLASVKRSVAGKIIKENSLGGLIEGAMDGDKPGSLVSMYNIYQEQLEYNDQAAKAKKAEKK